MGSRTKRSCLWLLLLLLIFSGCTQAAPTPTLPPATIPTTPAETVVTQPPDPIRALLDAMTTEEKVGQLFIIQPESIGITTEAEKVTPQLLQQYPVGGFLITGDNISGDQQIRQLISALQTSSKLPALIATDEEGGTVARFAN